MEDRLACRFQNRRPLKVSTRRYRALSEGQVCLGTTLDGREGRSATLLSSWGSGRSPCSRRLHTHLPVLVGGVVGAADVEDAEHYVNVVFGVFHKLTLIDVISPM